MRDSTMMQTHLLSCQLCESEQAYQLTMVDPRDSEYRLTVAVMLDHLVDVHGVPRVEVENRRERPLLFADGANGCARQRHAWFVPDGTKGGKVLVVMTWTREQRAKGRAAR